jgi:hypothetical protein
MILLNNYIKHKLTNNYHCDRNKRFDFSTNTVVSFNTLSTKIFIRFTKTGAGAGKKVVDKAKPSENIPGARGASPVNKTNEASSNNTKHHNSPDINAKTSVYFAKKDTLKNPQNYKHPETTLKKVEPFLPKPSSTLDHTIFLSQNNKPTPTFITKLKEVPPDPFSTTKEGLKPNTAVNDLSKASVSVGGITASLLAKEQKQVINSPDEVNNNSSSNLSTEIQEVIPTSVEEVTNDIVVNKMEDSGHTIASNIPPAPICTLPKPTPHIISGETKSFF